MNKLETSPYDTADVEPTTDYDDLLAGAGGGDAAEIDPSAHLNAGPTDDDIELPKIQVNGRQDRDIIDDANDALVAAGERENLFRMRGKIVQLQRGNLILPQVVRVCQALLKLILARCATWVRARTEATGGSIFHDAGVPRTLPEVLLAEPHQDLRRLEAVYPAPVLDMSGGIAINQGYSDSLGAWVENPAVEMDTEPTPENIEAALALIDEMFAGFPFDTPSDRANAIAMLLTPFIGPACAGNIPMFLVEAPAQGTGKTLLVRVTTSVFYPGGAAASTFPRCEEELRKRITSTLLEGRPFLFLDNITGTLDSSALASLLTSGTWEDRVLGGNSITELPANIMVVATANNAALGADMVRRIVSIRLDAKTERPEDRTGFAKPNLDAWVNGHRPELVGAVVTIISAWINAGSPEIADKPMGSFEKYSAMMAGMLNTIGIDGFRGNDETLRERADNEHDKFSAFYTLWHEQYSEAIEPDGTAKPRFVRADALYMFAEEAGLIADAEDKRDQRRFTSNVLPKLVGRIYAGYTMVKRPNASKTNEYALTTVEPREALAPGTPGTPGTVPSRSGHEPRLSATYEDDGFMEDYHPADYDGSADLGSTHRPDDEDDGHHEGDHEGKHARHAGDEEAEAAAHEGGEQASADERREWATETILSGTRSLTQTGDDNDARRAVRVPGVPGVPEHDRYGGAGSSGQWLGDVYSEDF